MIFKSFITTQLKEIIKKLSWETAHGRGEAVTIAHQVLADLDRVFSSIQKNEETGARDSLPSIDPKQFLEIDMVQALKLRARLAKATDELDRGLLATALSEYQAALAEWSGPPKG